MTDRTDMIFDMIKHNGLRVETMSKALGEVAEHCATLLERTGHLATRDDISTAIRLHVGECKHSHLPKPVKSASGNNARLIKATALFLATAAAALASYFGFRE